MEDCLFCKIANKEMPSEMEYEDEQFVAFKDIHPKAPVHLLIVPKRHIPSVAHLEDSDKEMAADLLFLAKQLAEEKGVAGYRLMFNVGRAGGQEVDHLHLHLLGYMSQDNNQ